MHWDLRRGAVHESPWQIGFNGQIESYGGLMRLHRLRQAIQLEDEEAVSTMNKLTASSLSSDEHNDVAQRRPVLLKL